MKSESNKECNLVFEKSYPFFLSGSVLIYSPRPKKDNIPILIFNLNNNLEVLTSIKHTPTKDQKLIPETSLPKYFKNSNLDILQVENKHRRSSDNLSFGLEQYIKACQGLIEPIPSITDNFNKIDSKYYPNQILFDRNKISIKNQTSYASSLLDKMYTAIRDKEEKYVPIILKVLKTYFQDLKEIPLFLEEFRITSTENLQGNTSAKYDQMETESKLLYLIEKQI